MTRALLLLLLAAAGSVQAEDAQPASPQAAAVQAPVAADASAAAPNRAVADDSSGKKCRMQRRTGSRNPVRVCQSSEQAREERKSGREFLEAGQRHTRAESGGG